MNSKLNIKHTDLQETQLVKEIKEAITCNKLLSKLYKLLFKMTLSLLLENGEKEVITYYNDAMVHLPFQ